VEVLRDGIEEQSERVDDTVHDHVEHERAEHHPPAPAAIRTDRMMIVGDSLSHLDAAFSTLISTEG